MGIVLAVLSVLVSCTEDDEYTQGQWIRRSDFDGVARCGASSFTMDGKGYLCCGYRGSNRDLLKDCWAYDIGRSVPTCPMRQREDTRRPLLP